jgi:hypothetical protein
MNGIFDCLNKDIPTSKKDFARCVMIDWRWTIRPMGYLKERGSRWIQSFCVFISFVHIHIILGSLGVILREVRARTDSTNDSSTSLDSSVYQNVSPINVAMRIFPFRKWRRVS